MTPAHSPAFQFYSGDWLGSERISLMTSEEEGVYIRLLAYCWRHGSIPADPKRIAFMVGKGASTTLAASVATMFQPDPNDSSRLLHDRLDAEREKQKLWREKSSKGGKKSAAGRKKKKSTVVQPPYQPKGNSSSASSFASSSSSLDSKEPKTPCDNPDCHGQKVSDESLDAAAIMADLVLKNNPKDIRLKGPKYHTTYQRWAEDIDKIHRINGYSWDQINYVIGWCQEDSFWMGNIRSGSKLRKQFDALVVKIKAEKEPKKVKSQCLEALALANKLTGVTPNDSGPSKSIGNQDIGKLPVPSGWG